MNSRSFLLLIPALSAFLCHANDGAFLANGNQLIPMYETDISVQKEILTIRRIDRKQAQITVYYECRSIWGTIRMSQYQLLFSSMDQNGR